MSPADMLAARYFRIVRSGGWMANLIPSGKQLPRTPPLTGVKKHLHFKDDQENMAPETSDQGSINRSKELDFSCLDATDIVSKPGDLSSMLKGMKGYQLTAGDLSYIQTMRVEQHIKTLQGHLEELQMYLTKETMASETAKAEYYEMKTQVLMRELSTLRSELLQEEVRGGENVENLQSVVSPLEMQMTTQEAAETQEDNSEKLQATNSQVNCRGKERKKGTRKPARSAQTTASRPKSKVKAGEAQSMSQQAAPSCSEAAEEAGEQNTGPRRSKRIASRT